MSWRTCNTNVTLPSLLRDLRFDSLTADGRMDRRLRCGHGGPRFFVWVRAAIEPLTTKRLTIRLLSVTIRQLCHVSVTSY